jgi:hypothetical protein
VPRVTKATLPVAVAALGALVMPYNVFFQARAVGGWRLAVGGRAGGGARVGRPEIEMGVGRAHPPHPPAPPSLTTPNLDNRTELGGQPPSPPPHLPNAFLDTPRLLTPEDSPCSSTALSHPHRGRIEAIFWLSIAVEAMAMEVNLDDAGGPFLHRATTPNLDNRAELGSQRAAPRQRH